MSGNGTVEVNNFDVMRLGLKKELSQLANKLNSTMKNTSKLNINIDHISELIQVIVKLMEVISAIELKPTFKPEINIPEVKLPEINVPEIKVPDIYIPEPRVTVNPAEVNIDLKGVIKALDNLKYISDRSDKPISVRMSDGQKFTKAIQQLKQSTDNLGVVYAGQSGVTADELKNFSGRLGTDFILSGTATLTPKFAKIDVDSSGDNTVVAAVATKKIRVLQLFLVAAGTVNTRFESGASGTALTGQMNLIGSTGYSLPFCPVGLFETAADELLNLELSGNTSVDGSLVYVEV